MKKIVLIGDSIRMGYDKHVKEALEDRCPPSFVRHNHFIIKLEDFRPENSLDIK